MANDNAADHYEGIYAATVLRSGNQSLPDSVYSNASITGVSLNLVWSQVETSKGHYNWSLLDKEIHRAVENGKQIALTLDPNRPDSPGWLLAEGAESHKFHIAIYGTVRPQDITIASPWDPIYQAEYANFMKALSDHLKAIPGAYDAVSVVRITGVNVATGETKLPNQFNSAAIWQAAGYTPDKVIDAWKHFAQATNSAFSDKIMGIVVDDAKQFPAIDNTGHLISETSSGFVDVTAKIIQAGLQMFGDNFMVMNCGLGSGHLSSVVTMAQQEGAIGAYGTNNYLPFQMGYGTPYNAVVPNEATYQSVLESATKAGVQYLEVWAGDAERNPNALSAAAALIHQYQDSTDHTILNLKIGVQTMAAVHGSTLTVTDIINNLGSLVIDNGADVTDHGGFTNRGSILADGGSFDIDNVKAGAQSGNFGQMSAQDGGHLHFADNLVNFDGGVISAEQNGFVDMDGNVTNRGTIEAESGGLLAINTTVNNNGGMLIADDAFMFVKALTGGGKATIEHDGAIEFGGAANAAVTFAAGGNGSLIIDQAALFKGEVSGFDTGDTLDFTDVNFVGTKLKYLPTAGDPHSGGILRIQTASNEIIAKVRIDGDYTQANFTAADDGHGHLLVQHHDLLV